MWLNFHLTFVSVFARLYVRCSEGNIRGLNFSLFVSICIALLGTPIDCLLM